MKCNDMPATNVATWKSYKLIGYKNPHYSSTCKQNETTKSCIYTAMYRQCIYITVCNYTSQTTANKTDMLTISLSKGWQPPLKRMR